MSGGEILCGKFQSGDKSGSALDKVLEDLTPRSEDLIRSIRSQLDDQMHVLISDEEARQLLPLLESYRDELIAEIGHDDWWAESEHEVEAGMDPVEAKWGASRGWRLYCATNMIGACRASMLEHEQICVAFS